MYPRSNCMPSTTSSSVSSDFASSTVMTPSLPTFFIASARKRPISASPLAEMVPTWAISSFEVTFLELACRSFTIASTARSTPRLRSIGFMPAATALAPSLTIACARTVAVEVRGLARDFAHHLGAHVLELVLKLDFLGDRHTGLGDARRAERLVQHDIAALGAERHSHRIGENIDAAQHLVASVNRKSYFLCSHVSLLLKRCSPSTRRSPLGAASLAKSASPAQASGRCPFREMEEMSIA